MSTPQRFRTSEVRRMMDVYSFDSQYLGSVLWLKAETGSSSEPELRPAVRQSSEIHGEALGTVPTERVGNSGPVTQSARRSYGTGIQEGQSLLEGSMLVGKYYGLMGVQWIPLDDIQTVAMERIILRHPAEHYESR